MEKFENNFENLQIASSTQVYSRYCILGKNIYLPDCFGEWLSECTTFLWGFSLTLDYMQDMLLHPAGPATVMLRSLGCFLLTSSETELSCSASLLSGHCYLSSILSFLPHISRDSHASNAPFELLHQSYWPAITCWLNISLWPYSRSQQMRCTLSPLSYALSRLILATDISKVMLVNFSLDR